MQGLLGLHPVGAIPLLPEPWIRSAGSMWHVCLCSEIFPNRPMTLILITSIFGIGEQYQIVNLPRHQALDLLDRRLALVATPAVRREFGERIRTAALR
jgi:hypothetical protein